MQGIRLNRNLLKLVQVRGGDIETYRFYLIVRASFQFRSGIFSTDELMDVLFSDYNYSSLHHRPGNGRRLIKNRLVALFDASFLFRKCPDGRYIARSERRILREMKGTDKSSWYEIPAVSLSSKGAFRDFSIGVLASGNRFRSNRKLASYCNCTVRRIQAATANNHKKGYFHKTYNFIEEKTASKETIDRERGFLMNLHGITSPLPTRYKGEWILRLNAPNAYRCLLLSGVKGFAQATENTGTQTGPGKCWFTPVKTQKRVPSLFREYEDSRRWVFNERHYTFDRYVQDNSKYLNDGFLSGFFCVPA